MTIFYIVIKNESIITKGDAEDVQERALDMDTIDTIYHRSRPSTTFRLAAERLARFLAMTAARLERMTEKRRSRRALMELTDEQLKDIGISRADAVGEGLKPFWD